MLEIAMALRLKGMASPEAIVEVTALEPDDVSAVLAQMIEAGHASDSPRGYRVTPEGKAWIDDLLETERASIDSAAVGALYERFCEHNDDFKQLVTDWQVKIIDGEQQMNDHSDAAYDAAIFDRLGVLDEAVSPVFAEAAVLAPRLSRYVDRFASALAAVRAGDESMVASPLKDSYHTVWFEMHEELILLSGRNRADEAAAGRGA